jgi:hypothetical protein
MRDSISCSAGRFINLEPCFGGKSGERAGGSSLRQRSAHRQLESREGTSTVCAWWLSEYVPAFPVLDEGQRKHGYSYYDVHILLALCPCDFSSCCPNLLLIIYDRWSYLIRRRVGLGLGTYMTERLSLLVMHTARLLAFFLAVIYLF